MLQLSHAISRIFHYVSTQLLIQVYSHSLSSRVTFAAAFLRIMFQLEVIVDLTSVKKLAH